MIKTKPPTSTKDHLKRFLEKNKTLMKVFDSQENNDRNKNKEIKKKTVSAKCSFIQCSPLIDKEKSQRVNENKLYKRILLTEDSYNSNLLEKNSSFPEKIRFNQSTILYTEEKSDTNHIPSMFKTLRTSSINLNTTNNSRYSSKIEEQSDNNKNNCSKKNNTSSSDRLDFTTPLEIWRQVNKEYKKNKNYYNNNNNHNTTITGDFITETKNNKNYSINRAKAFIEREINGLKQKFYIKKKQQSTEEEEEMINNNNTAEQLLQKYLFKESEDKIKKDNNKKRQNEEDELENKILLRRSLSCDEFEKSKIKCDNMFCYKGKEDNPNHNHKTYTQSSSNNESQEQHKYKFELLKSPKRTNPIVLLHKEPLDTCIQRYFNPLIRRVEEEKQENKLLSSVISKQIFMRIKAKKLTQRNVDKLERIKNDLFKELSRTTGMMGETLTTTLKTTTTDNNLEIDRKNKLEEHEQHHHNNKHMSWTTFKKATNNKRLSNKNLLLMNTSVSTEEEERLSKRRRASNKQNNFNNNKQREFDKRLLQAELVELDALHREEEHNKENTYIKDDNNLSENRLNILNRPQLIHLKIPSIINNNNSNSNSNNNSNSNSNSNSNNNSNSNSHQEQQLTNNNNNNINSNIIHTPTITTLRSSMISFGDCEPNYDDQQHNNNNKCKKEKKSGSFFNAW